MFSTFFYRIPPVAASVFYFYFNSLDIIFFNCYLTTPRPTLGHSQGDSLTKPMLNKVLLRISSRTSSQNIIKGFSQNIIQAMSVIRYFGKNCSHKTYHWINNLVTMFSRRFTELKVFIWKPILLVIIIILFTESSPSLKNTFLLWQKQLFAGFLQNGYS